MENELSFLINLGLGEISRKFVEKKCCSLVKGGSGFLLNSIFLHVSTRSSLYAEACKFLEVSVKEQGI